MHTFLIIEPFGVSGECRKEEKKMPELPVIDLKATGRRIRDCMDRAALKPLDIQTYLGLTCVQTVYRWLDGTNIPTIDHLYALSRLFGIRVDDIIMEVQHDLAGEPDYKMNHWILTYYKNWGIHPEAN